MSSDDVDVDLPPPAPSAPPIGQLVDVDGVGPAMRFPATPEQQRLWRAYRLAPKSHAYVTEILFRIRGPLELRKMHAFIHFATDYCEAFRHFYREENDQIYCYFAPPEFFPQGFEVVDFAHVRVSPEAQSAVAGAW